MGGDRAVRSVAVRGIAQILAVHSQHDSKAHVLCGPAPRWSPNPMYATILVAGGRAAHSANAYNHNHPSRGTMARGSLLADPVEA